MTSAFVLMGLMAAALMVAAQRRGRVREGLITSWRMFMGVLPLLVLAFVLVGFIQVLLPRETLHTWMGEEAGWKGLLLGTGIGALIQGGPYGFFPLFGSVFRDNVSTGTAVAMITAWGMINVGHLPYEMAFLGHRFVVLKYSLYLFLPPLAGLLAQMIFG